MKQSKKYRLTIKSVTEEKASDDGSVETAIKVKTTDVVIDEKASAFPINDVVLEKENIKRENFKDRATTDVRNAANRGENITRSIDYWKETIVKDDKKKDDKKKDDKKKDDKKKDDSSNKTANKKNSEGATTDENTVTINEQGFSIDQVKQAFKDAEGLSGLSGNVNKTRIINELKKLDDAQVDALLVELETKE